MELQWYGTATIFFQEDDTTVLFDPYISLNEKVRAYNHELAAEIKHILITHGHFDHLVDVPELLKDKEKTVHCSKTAAETLLKEGVNSHQINIIAPEDSLEIGPFHIRVLSGEHINFDFKLIMSTLFNRRLLQYKHNLRTIARSSPRKYPQGEVLVFEIEAKGKKVLHMGSLNLDEKEKYPEGVDLLTLPFQGRSDINEYALPFVEKLKPKALYLHHFDDTFPPVSQTVNCDIFVEKIRNNFPEVKVIVPEYGKTVAV